MAPRCVRLCAASRGGLPVGPRVAIPQRALAGPPMCPPSAMSGALSPDGAASAIETARIAIATELAGELVFDDVSSTPFLPHHCTHASLLHATTTRICRVFCSVCCTARGRLYYTQSFMLCFSHAEWYINLVDVVRCLHPLCVNTTLVVKLTHCTHL